MTDNHDAETRARTRYAVITLTRLGGAVIVVAGLMLYAGPYRLLDPAIQPWLGLGLVAIGLFDFVVLPQMLARRWRSGD